MGTLTLFLLYSVPALGVQIVGGLLLWIYLHFRKLYGSRIWWGSAPACAGLLIVPCGYGGVAVAVWWRSGGWGGGGMGDIFVSTIVPPKFEILLIFPNFL